MKILKTYARMFVRSLDESLPFLEQLVGKPTDLRFSFAAIELAAVGDLLVIASAPEDITQYRRVVGPFIVASMEETEAFLAGIGARITQPRREVPTGLGLWATHPDGTEVEYVQWKPELVERIIGKSS